MYSVKFITGAHSTNSVRMTGGRRQASDAVHSHVIGALELNFHQGGWCRIFNLNLMYNVKFIVNFARARRLRRRTRAPGGLAPPVPPHAAAAAPSGPTVVESDTDVLLCKSVGRGGKSILVNRTFLEQS